MKRCPQCNRDETNDALAFCRVDGTPLVNDSSSVGRNVNTAKLGSESAVTEIETRILPRFTDASISRSPASTSVLTA